MKKAFSTKWFRQLFRRRILIILMLLLQIGFLAYLVISGSRFSQGLSRLFTLISLIVALYIVSMRDKGAYKLTWVFLILLFPLFGGLLYLLFKFQTSTKRFSEKMHRIKAKANPLYSFPENGYQKALSEIPEQIPQIRYLQEFAGFPIYTGTSTKFYTPGEVMFQAMKEELEKAE